MRNFFARYGYGSVKMFVNQFAVSLLGMVLSLAASGEKNRVLLILASTFSVLMYLFLIYIMTWEIGAKDKIAIDYGKIKRRPYIGFLMALVANIPNFIIAIIYTVICMFTQYDASIVRRIAFFFVGMYQGFLRGIEIGGVPIYEFWWSYFVIIIPSVITAGLAYWLGIKNIHFTKLMVAEYPESDREPKKKWFGKDK
ncbi:MAG: hypothetical protein E7640_01335 [Ruminococcaceae bacterium]|nr:hypothetical protein [Oscillospiraceae bacterium]